MDRESDLVTAWKRTAAWTASLVIGASLYSVFSSLLTAAPAREKAKVRGRIEALTAEALARPKKLPSEDVKYGLSSGRARSSLLAALHSQEAGLARAQVVKRFWALVIGLVAFGGCFVLCTASWWTLLVKGAVLARNAPGVTSG